MEKAAERAPARALVSIKHMGMSTAFIASDCAKLIAGDTMAVHEKTLSCLGSGNWPQNPRRYYALRGSALLVESLPQPP